jgi:hypothetical protein
MRRTHTDLLLAAGVALAAMTVILLGVEHPALRLLFGLPLTVLLPGYALTAALFPRPTLPGPDRALYSLGLSLSASILGGFALHVSPWGLAPSSWAALLTELTLGGCIVAFARRRLLPAQPTPTQPADQAAPDLRLSLGQGVLLALSIAVVAGAVGFARGEAQQRPAADVLQLWMRPEAIDGRPAVRIGLNSVGPAEGTFRLQLMRDGYLVHEWPAIAIQAGSQWEERLILAGRQPGAGAFEARLSRVGEPQTVIRRVAVWVAGQP